MAAPHDLRALVDRYCAAVTARDIDAVVAMFTDDAVQADPASAPPNVGHEAIRAFLQSAVDASASTRFEAVTVHTCGNQVAFDFRVTVGLGTSTMVIEGIEVFTVADDGRIESVTAYWDDADVAVTDAP